jgi:hypothetical protein
VEAGGCDQARRHGCEAAALLEEESAATEGEEEIVWDLIFDFEFWHRCSSAPATAAATCMHLGRQAGLLFDTIVFALRRARLICSEV